MEIKEVLTPLQEWENSLMSSTSYAQLFVHLTTLDSSIIWSKSILNTRCRICRRKADPEHMLLCDGCDRGHHLYCLKPKLKSIPKGDWFCRECKPKERIKSPKKKSRRVFINDIEPEAEPETEAAEEEDQEDEDVEDEPATGANSSDDEEPDDADEEDDDDEREEETPPRRTKKSKRSVDPPKKAKKAAASTTNTSNTSNKKKGLSQLLGKRKSATQASEKIARFTQEETAASSGNSSGNESIKDTTEDNGIKGERQSTRLRGKSNTKTSASLESAKQLKEQRLSAESGLSKARNKRRRAVDEELLNMYNPSALEDLLNNMMKHKDGWPFDRPITRSDAPDYFEIIKRPIDLGTVRTNLLHMKYSCNQEVLVDVRQVFENCYRYNAEDAEEYQCAQRLEKYFERATRKLGLVEEDDDYENQPLSKKSRRTM